MSNWHWFLIAWLVISGLFVFVRGIVGSTREYDLADSFFGAVEIAFLVWVVAVKL